MAARKIVSERATELCVVWCVCVVCEWVREIETDREERIEKRREERETEREKQREERNREKERERQTERERERRRTCALSHKTLSNIESSARGSCWPILYIVAADASWGASERSAEADSLIQTLLVFHQ